MLYSELVPLCCDPAGVVLLDMTSQVQSTVKLIRNKCATIILKVNIKELCAVTGTPVQGGSDSSASRSGALLSAASNLASQIGVGGGAKIVVAATDGAFAAHLLLLDPSLPGVVAKHLVYSLPRLPRPLINPIGAGDACASGLLLAISGKVEIPVHQTQTQKIDIADVEGAVEAFRWGLACGAASCMTEGNSVLSRSDAVALFRDIEVFSQS
jgi:sugar/nucleoside kinase (ribokinase family)